MNSSRSNTGSSRLERRAGEIAAAFGGTWSGAKGMCRCPAHDDRSPSLAIGLGDHAILFHCFAGCSSNAVLAAFARHGIRASDLFDGSGGPIAPLVRSGPSDRNALRLWREAKILAGTPADEYLAARNLRLGSPDLRFHAATPLGKKPQVRFLPAMIAAVRTDEAIVAVHRTFLDTGYCPATKACTTAGSVRVAGFDRPKRALGRLGTGAVRLATPSDGRLGLAEGIESALSAQQIFGIACWATLGNERFGIVTIPDSVRELTLFIDADAGGKLAEQRGRTAYARDGRIIVTQRPAIQGQDWNDVLTAQSGPPHDQTAEGRGLEHG